MDLPNFFLFPSLVCVVKSCVIYVQFKRNATLDFIFMFRLFVARCDYHRSGQYIFGLSVFRFIKIKSVAIQPKLGGKNVI